MVYGKDKYLSNYSLRIQKILDACDLELVDRFVHIRKHTVCHVYKRTDEVKDLLTLIKKNKELKLGYTDKQIVEKFKSKKIKSILNKLPT